MSRRSPLQRFLGELRRRHVPQTVAVYAVAAWAAIEFADVIVPNLGWPQGVVTAVIIAAAVGLPAVVVLAWVFDWGPEGIRRTPPDGGAEAEREAAVGRTGAGTPQRSYGPWLAAVVVLAVAIGSGVAVAMLTRDRPEEAAEADAPQTRSERRAERGGEAPGVPGVSDPGFADSILRTVRDSIGRNVGGIDGLDLDSIMGMALRFAETTEPAGAGAAIEIIQPEPWRIGVGHPVAPGDTVRIRGVARDTRGIAVVLVGDDTVASAPRRGDPPTELPFEATLVGAPSHAARVSVALRTVAGDEVRREFPVIRIPARPEP